MTKEKKAKKPSAPFNPYDQSFNLKHDMVTGLYIVAVCFIQCCVLAYFYTPNHFLSGGITGVSMLFEYTLGISKSIPMMLLNIPIAIVGVRHQGVKFVVFSMFATVCYSLMFELPLMDMITEASMTTEMYGLGTHNQLLAAIVGGAILGVTGVPIVKRGASLGGLDVVSVIISRKLSIQMGTINIGFNLVIMTILGFCYGVETALYSIITMFVCNMAFNFGMRGMNHIMTVFIISEQWDEIAPHVLRDMHRGVTYIHAEGAYTGQPRKLVYCIVKTTELTKLKKIVKDHDPNALFSIIDTLEVVGRGFGSIN